MDHAESPYQESPHAESPHAAPGPQFDFGDAACRAAEVIMAAVNAKREERPVGEFDAELKIGDLKMTFGITVYGTYHATLAGDREQPVEREFVEIDRVILSSGPDAKCDIYDALSYADLQNISDAICGASD